ncbi:MAG TPA: redox-sensing transcriptional repressor Rex [Feifaniaceae bacterium]|nr:redox-sensing transcriptional repressor Rex [Feifaniaceae bacterium]
MQKESPVSISRQALQRMPYYLQSLRAALDSGAEIISAPTVAAQLGLNEVQVRKDFASVSNIAGKPKTGFQTRELIAAIESCLGYDNSNEAVLVGAGSLGRALLSYRGFEAYGLSIVAAFDVDANLTGGEISGKQVLPMSKLTSICQSMNIHIGIITVPASQAQAVCDALVSSGVLAIWNFAPMHLNTPEGILVQNENMAASLAVLSKHLSERLESGLVK